MKEALKRLIPKPLEDPARAVYHATADCLDWLFLRRGRGRLTPPKRLVGAIGGGDFEAVGRDFLQYFVSLAGLQPHERVLDVGCGSGRMAAPLTDYLSSGSYEGFDITPDTVRWCQTKITPEFPTFRFRTVDVYSAGFNPEGKFRASEFRFPYEDGAFDFVFLTSVFTHMLPADMENYLSEIARVLRPGGRCFITFFLLSDESERLIREGKSTLTFEFERGGYRVNLAENPEMAVAYQEAFIRALFEKHGFTLDPIRYGSWCGRAAFTSYQEIVVARHGL
jgi:SAM-dependent methyltransferase